ncbi:MULTISPECIES: siderophore-interacting protein [unclassified Serratia (in: enterobacteria)]|uniref:siderophore-interacting protein n=1 Tax=unclassified Serratia (in: enterobacteria) TaxID=2647522 RepID=UPI0004FFD250|nr:MULTISPECIES: siderophore-interacting protein [unclassified Serratia (in: enterobacteria)]KFK94299.1 FAD-binding protein [Serratia sp. Ag1]KFK95887.1 FAD-binding protein [Serratia sp. Ag2]
MTAGTPRPRAPYLIEVTRLCDITPHLRRITFSAPDLCHYPANAAAAHIKVFLPCAGQTQPDLPTLSDNGPVWPADAVRPIVRTYSIRAVRPEQAEIDIEFALHDHNGPAVNFARQAKPGDKIGISNPGGPKPMLPAADFYCLAGDPSSLPAIAALLENLPANSTGRVFIRVDTPADVLDLKKPANVELSWIIGSTDKTAELITQFCAQPLPQAGIHFWLAGEDRLVVELRRYLRREWKCDRNQLYAVPYWREGLNEEGYHEKRHEIMDNIDS